MRDKLNLMVRVQTRANYDLIKAYPDEYQEAMKSARQMSGSTKWKAVQLRAITIMKKTRHSEWRELFNKHAELMGYHTAEMRREEAIAKLQAEIDRLKTEGLKYS